LIDINEFILKQNRILTPPITNNSVNIVLYVDEKYDDDDKLATTTKVNDYYEIIYYIKNINKSIKFLDTKLSQETFITLLVAHELCHTVIRNYSLSDEDYEYLVNSNAINYMHKYTKYKFKNIKNSVEREINRHKDIFNDGYIYLAKQIFMFPIGKDEYFE
jgi:hypothetical protein